MTKRYRYLDWSTAWSTAGTDMHYFNMEAILLRLTRGTIRLDCFIDRLPFRGIRMDIYD